jgi:hypothetical protein
MTRMSDFLSELDVKGRLLGTHIMKIAALIFAFLSLRALAFGQGDMNGTENAQEWKTFPMPEYGLQFRYPPNAKVDDLASALGGEWTIDGLRRSPISVKLMAEHSPYLMGGVFHRFVVRIIMLTNAAQLDPMWAKKYGWTERPRTDLYPFDAARDERALRLAVEQLYLSAPQDWTGSKPISIGARPAVLLGCWRPRGEPREKRHFEELIAIPLNKGRILLLHAGYFHVKSAGDLKDRRDIFLRIAQTVVLDGS